MCPCSVLIPFRASALLGVKKKAPSCRSFPRPRIVGMVARKKKFSYGRHIAHYSETRTFEKVRTCDNHVAAACATYARDSERSRGPPRLLIFVVDGLRCV